MQSGPSLANWRAKLEGEISQFDPMREQKHELSTWSRSSWKVKRTLERNRSLLRHLRGNRHVAREEATDWLVRRGFDFDYHTHLSTTQEGRLVVMCYDEGTCSKRGVVPWGPRFIHARRLFPELRPPPFFFFFSWKAPL